MGKFKDALQVVANHLTNSSSGSGSAGDIMDELGDEMDVSSVGRALLGANDAAAARDAIGAPGIAAAHADSTATEVAGIVVDFNALLGKLRTAGILETEE